MATAIEDLMGGGKQGKLVKNLEPITASSYKYLYIREDSVISAITSTSDKDVLAQWNMAGETFLAGDIIFAHNGEGIKAVTFTSGSGFVLGEVL
jgi:hypothetical protein